MCESDKERTTEPRFYFYGEITKAHAHAKNCFAWPLFSLAYFVHLVLQQKVVQKKGGAKERGGI